jgi:hypothetical protein
MNEQTRNLAEQAGATPWSQPPMRAVTGVAFTYDALEKFAELVEKNNTQRVVHLCAQTIDSNLRTEQQKKKNKQDWVEVVIISVLILAWCSWWYSMGHP